MLTNTQRIKNILKDVANKLENRAVSLGDMEALKLIKGASKYLEDIYDLDDDGVTKLILIEATGEVVTPDKAGPFHSNLPNIKIAMPDTDSVKIKIHLRGNSNIDKALNSDTRFETYRTHESHSAHINFKNPNRIIYSKYGAIYKQVRNAYIGMTRYKFEEYEL